LGSYCLVPRVQGDPRLRWTSRRVLLRFLYKERIGVFGRIIQYIGRKLCVSIVSERAELSTFGLFLMTRILRFP